jgi:hypothetical protein
MRFLPARLALAAFATLGLAATPAAAGPPPGAVTIAEVASFHYASPLAPPRTLRLSGSNGGITVSASTDGKLDVTAVARDGDASRIRVVTREEAGGVAVCVLFADESPDGCQLSGVDRSHSGRGHHNEPTVDLVARVPAGVALTAGTLNGAIRARGMTGEVRATTLNGDVEVTGSNVAEATTLNGNVDATFGSVPTGRVELSTNNGNVRVSFPAGANADVEASTIHGEITTSFPMAIQTTPGGFGPKSGKARLGNGGARVQAKSINGNVEVRSGG